MLLRCCTGALIRAAGTCKHQSRKATRRRDGTMLDGKVRCCYQNTCRPPSCSLHVHLAARSCRDARWEVRSPAVTTVESPCSCWHRAHMSCTACASAGPAKGRLIPHDGPGFCLEGSPISGDGSGQYLVYRAWLSDVRKDAVSAICERCCHRQLTGLCDGRREDGDRAMDCASCPSARC